MKHVVFICPAYNASSNIRSLVASLSVQSNDSWSAVFIDDFSDDETADSIDDAIDSFGLRTKCTVKKNEKRAYALKNIVDVSRTHQDDDDCIIAIIDGDDELCNKKTVDVLVDAYTYYDADVVWTAHRWDVNGMNISCEMPKTVNPYQWRWCSSHLKTFRASMLRDINDANFVDSGGNWFQRGYDQALMLPLLYNTHKRVYVPDVCYLYKINSCSIIERDWVEREQISTINFVRARGYLK